MKNIFIYIVLLWSTLSFAQNEQLAQYYYERGDFEKAKLSYEELLANSPSNTQYFLRTVDCYQQLQQYDLAEKTIQSRYSRYKQGTLLIELGYNYQLQKDEKKANSYYNQALEKITQKPNEVFGIANSFEKKVLLDYALKAYQTASTIQPNYNFNFQIGLLYGQLGKTDLMIETLLTESFQSQQNSNLIQSQLARFMSDDIDTGFRDALRKALILRTQKDQDVYWNHYLSWFYVQQQEFSKAFIQEKAIYKREPESLASIINLAQFALDEDDEEVARKILTFVIANSKDLDVLVQANTKLMKIKIEEATYKEFPAIDAELTGLLSKFEISPFTLSLQLIQAHFVAFNLKKPEEARTIIKNAMDLPLNNYQIAEAKMELADILLFEEKFNQALLYYSQIELDLKNDVVAHEASLKAAKTSYFKTDFVWALKQFKTLKSASTQLIANDALEYFLLINDNTVADSTQVALKAFAKGDYLLYQNRKQEAIVQFQLVLNQFKGNEIETVTLLRLGQTHESLKQYDLALAQFQLIIDHHSDGIYADEALFFSAEIYNEKLQNPEKAKPLYEKIIFNHQDSIYFVEARKTYRTIRGDTNL
ncbi:tetratricopeptide repeat protein [Flavobacterium sp. TAB 87]|uniref:tetratricopeptide repeat protein n=1 Tax=Flavobacterium sp. TAB 87 TaxID=1729581 RepID=UPI00076C564E|nr:tetratricopeptide repeat protein [Flavobacterium sp. TAB 87]KVV13393.1 putative PEP-CTERM system TPR-repeat lipoprotein [Flavobacterium sp. TAB 87]